MDNGLLTLLMMVSLHGIASDDVKFKQAFGNEPFPIEKPRLIAKLLACTPS